MAEIEKLLPVYNAGFVHEKQYFGFSVIVVY